MKRIVPLWLQMRPGTQERLIAWMKWRNESENILDLIGEDLIRDGSYDLYKTISKSDKKRRELFQHAYNQITKAQFNEVLAHKEIE